MRRHAIEFVTSTHRASPTSEAVAHAARVRGDRIAKSVVLGDHRGYVLAVLPASRRVDLDRLRDELGRALHLVPEGDLEALFPDCAIGAIPPVGAAYGLPTVLDAVLERQGEVFFEAGDHETLVRVDGASFLELLEQAEVAEISMISPGLEAARITRERLYEAGLDLGQAIAVPIRRGPRWRQRVGRAFERLADELETHVSESEGPDGVLREIVEQAPRLWRDVEALEAEHAQLSGACALLQRQLQAGGDALVIRQGALALLNRLAAHRHRGADLAYEAFGVDLGVG